MYVSDPKPRPSLTSRLISYFKDWTWLVPDKMYKHELMSEMFCDKIRYVPEYVLEDLACSRVYFAEMLCVAKDHRGIGLGREMVMQSMDVARDMMGCEAYFAVVSSIYSQKIYSDLGFETLVELKYEDFRDKYGKVLIKDGREHTLVRSVYKKFV